MHLFYHLASCVGSVMYVVGPVVPISLQGKYSL